MGSDCQVYLLPPGILKAPDGRYSYIAKCGSEASLKVLSGVPTCIAVSGQVFLQRQVWAATPKFSERARWGCGVASVARGGIRHPPQLILRYSAGIPIAVQELLFISRQIQVVTPSISTARGRVKRGNDAQVCPTARR